MHHGTAHQHFARSPVSLGGLQYILGAVVTTMLAEKSKRRSNATCCWRASDLWLASRRLAGAITSTRSGMRSPAAIGAVTPLGVSFPPAEPRSPANYRRRSQVSLACHD